MASDNNTTPIYDYHINTQQLLFKIIPPFVFIPGTIGNILAILVLRRPQIANLPTTPYLLSLAVADILSLLIPLFRVWLAHTTGFDIRDSYDAVCKLHIYLSYIAIYTSLWIQAAVNVDRFIYVKWPFKWNRIQLRHRVIVISSIVLFFFAIDIHIAVYFTLTWYDKKGNVGCYIANTNYRYFLNFVWSWLDLVIGFLLPFITMLICSVALVYNLWKNKRGVNHARLDSPGEIARSTTKLVVSLNVVFFISTLPKRLYSITVPYYETADENVTVAYVYVTVYILMYLNHAVNFALYVLQGPRYREALRSLLGLAKNGESIESLAMDTVTQNVNE